MATLIVTCDGGGMRGLITSLLLDNLQTQTNGFLSNVNIFAGTSTGSFIALGLASGAVTTTDLIDLYENDGSSIFTPYSPSSGAQPSPAVQRLAAARADASSSSWLCDLMPSLCYAMYTNDTGSPLYQTATQLFTVNGQVLTLGALTTEVVVTTNVLWDSSQNAWYPALVHNFSGSPYTDMTLVDAALSSGAAPIYFPPYWNSTFNSYCADGGTFANNPASAALTAAMQAGVISPSNLSDVYVLSMNTGVVPNGMQPSYIDQTMGGPQNMGILGWLLSASPSVPEEALISLMFDTISDIDTIQAQALLGSGNFMRPQGPVLTQPYSLDDWQDYQTLVNATNAYINGESGQPGDWANVVSWVKANFT